MKPKVGIVRGKFLNQYEMQWYEPLTTKFNITAFGSLTSFHSRFAFPVIKLLSPMDIPDFPYKMSILNRLFVDAHYLWGLERHVKGFDLLHSAETYYNHTQQCLDAKKKGYVKKVITTVLENIPFNNEGIWGRLQFKMRSRLELDHIIALTKRSREALILEGADPAKISVLGFFVDTKRFSPSQYRKKQLSNRKATVSILFAGRLEVAKGVYELLYAAKKLQEDKDLTNYHVTYTIVGSGREDQKLYETENTLGLHDIVTHKSVIYEAMSDIYKDADIFVAPSKPTQTWAEQYNIALLEAQASGLAIVTTNSGSIVENVGDAAVLVQPADFVALASAIKEFILNPVKRALFSKKARQRALQVHDSRIGASKLTDIYQRVLYH